MIKKFLSQAKKLYDNTRRTLNKVKRSLDKIKKEHVKEKKGIKGIIIEEVPVKNERIVYISVWSVVKSTLAIFVLYFLMQFLYAMNDILLLVAISLFFAATIDPMVDKMETKRIPRWAGVILIYLLVLAIIIIFFAQIIPLVAVQIKEIVVNLSIYFKNLYLDFVENNASIPIMPNSWNAWLREFLVNIRFDEIIDYLLSNLTSVRDYLQKVASGSLEALKTAGVLVGDTVVVFVSFVFKLILVLFLIFFMVVDKGALKKFFTSLFPPKYAPYISKKTAAMQFKIGDWVRGQMLLVVSMFILALIGLSVLQVKYAMTLALLTGMADIIPYLGPFIAYICIIPVVLNQDPWLFIWVTLWFIFIQQLEGNVLVPLIMQKAVGLNPIIVMVAMLIGFKFLGILGVIIAVPIATIIAIFVHDYTAWTQKNHNKN